MQGLAKRRQRRTCTACMEWPWPCGLCLGEFLASIFGAEEMLQRGKEPLSAKAFVLLRPESMDSG